MTNFLEEALTYDDVLLVPQYSEVVPTEISTRSFFCKRHLSQYPVDHSGHGHSDGKPHGKGSCSARWPGDYP